MSSTPRAFRSFITLSQNLAPSVVSFPEAENVLRSICCDAKREIDSLVADQAFVADPRIKSEDKP
jgi:hypothetical protein